MTTKFLLSAIIKADKTLLSSGVNRQMRNFFAYLRIAFNKVDTQRLQEVGPNILCAEWVIKNGGAVQFDNQRHPISDYNSIALGSGKSTLKLIDATDSSIMGIGFEHFKGCNSIEHIILNRCKHLENEALEKLAYVNSLRELQVTNCPNVVESGLLSLKQLNHLQKLTIYGFIYIDNFNSVVNELQKELPDCHIITTPQ